MPGKNESRRRALFNQYLTNLDLVKVNSILSLRIEPNIPNSIMCPMCFNVLTQEFLEQDQALTLDHNPPAGLGGKSSQGVLLCGDCNHSLGSDIDTHLMRTLEAEASAQWVAGTEIRGTLTIPDLPAFPVTYKLPNDGAIEIYFTPKATRPDSMRTLEEYLQGLTADDTFNGTIQIKGGKQAESSLALLRIAYLNLFRLFGYGLLISPAYFLVREQLNDASASLLDHSWRLPLMFTQNLEDGVYLVTIDEQIRLFASVFELKRKGYAKRYAVALPTVDADGKQLFAQLSALSRDPAPRQIRVNHINPRREYWTDPIACMASFYYSFPH